MSVYTGRNAKATFGSDLIIDVTSYTFSHGSELLKDFVFGNSGYQTVAGQGGIESSGNMSFLINIGDTLGQDVMEARALDGAAVTNFRLYLTPTDYWTTVSGSNTFFTNYTVEAEANGITRGSVDFEMDGPVERTA